MSLLHTPTAAESRRTFRENLMLKVAEATHHVASTELLAHEEFWAVEPVQLVAELNADLANSLALMAAQNAQAVMHNTSLALFADVKNSDGSQRFPNRAPTEIGNPNITFDGTEFVYTAPTEPEEEEP